MGGRGYNRNNRGGQSGGQNQQRDGGRRGGSGGGRAVRRGGPRATGAVGRLRAPLREHPEAAPNLNVVQGMLKGYSSGL